MIEQLIKFLIDRKVLMLQHERVAKGRAKIAITSQIQVIESVLTFLSQNKNQEGENINMDTLKLTLDREAKSLDELKPRKGQGEMTEAILKIAEGLPPGTYKQINTKEVSGKSVIAKIYFLKKQGKLPESIAPLTRGKDVFIARKK